MEHSQKQRIVNEAVRQASREWADKGKLIEAGWATLRLMSIPADAPPLQIEEMRNAFFAGAQHLFASIMTVLDPGSEETDGDMRKMDLISKELDDFIAVYSLKHLPTEGQA